MFLGSSMIRKIWIPLMLQEKVCDTLIYQYFNICQLLLSQNAIFPAFPFFISVSHHLSKCMQCRRNIRQGILFPSAFNNLKKNLSVLQIYLSGNHFVERKEMKFGIMNTDTSCSISSALSILRSLNTILPGNLNFYLNRNVYKTQTIKKS